MSDSGNGAVVIGWLPQPICGTTVVQQGFFDSFYGFLSHDTTDRKVFGGYTICGTGYIASGRDTLCEKFLQTDAEWLLQIDWDITFSPDSVYALLDAADPIERPIIAGCYVTFFGDDEPVLRPCWMQKVGTEDYVPSMGLAVGEVVECTTVGMGFTLIHRTVLEAMAKEYADDPWHFFGHDIVNGSRMGEDLTFCHRARQLGFSVWGHGGVLLGHTKSKTFVVSDMADEKMSRVARPGYNPSVLGKRVLNVGGGSKLIPIPVRYDGWDHVLLDVAANDLVDVVGDATDPDTWVDLKDYDAIYCSHNLEHYYMKDIPTVLAGFKSALKPGGIVDLRVPDMGLVADRLSTGGDIDDHAYDSPAGPITYRDMTFGCRQQTDAADNDFYKHKTSFTADILKRVLQEAGFVNVSVLTPNEFELQATAFAPK